MSNNTTTYKDSPLGKIPIDWEVKELKDVCRKITDGTHDTPIPTNLGIPFLTALHVKEEMIDFDGCYYIPVEIHKEIYRRCNPERDDVLMVNIGAGVATTALVNVDYEFSLKNVALLKPDYIKVIGQYLNYYQTFIKPKLTQSLLNGGAQPFLSLKQIQKLKILLPTITEQRAIATCLTTIDEAINKNNQLIAQKELRKKWLMQQLLTGKKRVKGFGGEWKEIHIRDIAKEVSIRNKADKQLTVLSCTKYIGLVPSLEYFGRKIFADDVSTYKVVPKNHFAYATNHIEEGSIGYQEILDEALISPMYTVFKTDSSINDNYFYKLLKSHKLVYQYQNRMEGSIDRRGGLRWDTFSTIKIHIPEYSEQTAIAQVLQTADKEIQLLKAKAEKLKEEKKGMMQVLLTGKKRLNQDLSNGRNYRMENV